MNALPEENNMSMAGDPIRLRRMVARGSLLERGLDAAQASGPSDEQLQALERRVLVGLGATTAAAAAVTIAKTAGAQTAGSAVGWLSAGSAKLIVTLVATVTIAGGSVAVWHVASNRRPNDAAVATPARPSPGVSGRRAELPAAVPSPALSPTFVAPAQASRSHSAGMGAPEPIVAGSARTDIKPTSESKARWARPPQQPAIAPPRAAATFRAIEASRAGSGESARETSDEELSLLARANRALAKSPALALTVADEHTRRFPQSTMDQERELIAITALVDLGQMREAQRRANQFTRAHPSSIYQTRIEKALAPRP